MSLQASQGPKVTFRHPDTHDGHTLWEITKRSGSLDLNSPYHYLIMSRHFGNTSVVAELDGAVAGFVTAYIPPTHPDTLFVWQVAVDHTARGQGLAKQMLVHAFQNAPGQPLAFLEATITPSNTASTRLFTAASRALNAPFAFRDTVFSEADFGANAHEPEILFRIGPTGLPARTQSASSPAARG